MGTYDMELSCMTGSFYTLYLWCLRRRGGVVNAITIVWCRGVRIWKEHALVVMVCSAAAGEETKNAGALSFDCLLKLPLNVRGGHLGGPPLRVIMVSSMHYPWWKRYFE